MDAATIQEFIASLDASLVEQYGARAAPRLAFADTELPRGPHLALGPSSAALLPAADALPVLSHIAAGLTPLNDLKLHACLPVQAMEHAIAILTARGWHSGCHGLGRAMIDRSGRGQCQYLVDFTDVEVASRFSQLCDDNPGLHALRAIMRAVVQSGGVGSVAGMADAAPVPGVAYENHFWLRLSSGGRGGGNDGEQQQQQHFNTNGNGNGDNDAEACWHIDNPRAPTTHRTSRMILKLYCDGGRPQNCHVLELRGAPLRLSAHVPVSAGDGVVMSDFARGSSIAAVSHPHPCVEHRGRCPAGEWQLELLLNCVLNDREKLVDSLRATARELREKHEAMGLGATLADGQGCSLRVDSSQFVNAPMLATKEDARQRFMSNALAAPASIPVAVAVPVSLGVAQTLAPGGAEHTQVSHESGAAVVAVAVPVVERVL